VASGSLRSRSRLWPTRPAGFSTTIARRWWLPIILTPCASAITCVTRRLVPAANGSGIPQIIAAKADPETAIESLASARTSVVTIVLMAGVAAASNTPLAGIAFAIEELAAAYEQRMTLLVVTAG
jgi:H+/Cl- antiporter ClcA